MKKIFYPLIGMALLLIASCENSSSFVSTYKSDLNDKGDWINCKTVGKFGGVAGDYCCKVDSNYEYAYGFRKLISEISPDPVKRIKASVWVKLTDLSKKIVFAVSISNADGTNLFWSGHDINPLVKKTDTWVKINIEDVFTDFDPKEANVTVVVWNLNKVTAYIDDYDIRFYNE